MDENQNQEGMELTTKYFKTKNKIICNMYGYWIRKKMEWSRKQFVYCLVVRFREDADIMMSIVSVKEEKKEKEIHHLTDRMSCYTLSDENFPWAYTTLIEDEFISEMQHTLSDDENMVVLYRDPKRKCKQTRAIKYHMMKLMKSLAEQYEGRVHEEHEGKELDREKLNERIRQINKLHIDLDEMMQSIADGEL